MKMKSEKIGTRRPRRVLVVDQSPVVRQAVASWLKRTLDLAVCAEADSPSSALKAAHDFKPDVIVTEILRQQDLGFIQSLHEQHPELPILVLSFRDEGWYAPLALAAGADGYLMKGESVRRLLAGIRRTLQGGVALSPTMRARLRAKCLRRRSTSGTAPKRRCRCGAPRERERR